MDTFDKIRVLNEDHSAIWARFEECNQILKEIVKAVSERLENEREQTATLIYSATQKATDMSRPETIRKIAESELKNLEARTFSPTAEEIAAFDEVMREAQAALSDARKTRGELIDAIRDAKSELENIRKKSGGESAELAERWLDDAVKKFEKLKDGNYAT